MFHGFPEEDGPSGEQTIMVKRRIALMQKLLHPHRTQTKAERKYFGPSSTRQKQTTRNPTIDCEAKAVLETVGDSDGFYQNEENDRTGMYMRMQIHHIFVSVLM